MERVAERVSSLSKLKSVLVTDSHAQLLQRPCSATYGHEQRRRRLPSSSGGPRGREGRRARRARERRRRRLARAGLRGVGRGTTCSGRSARSAQLGDDEGDHAARSASRGQEPTPSSPPGRRIETSLRRKRVRGGGSRRACGARASGVEDRDEPAAQSRPGWRIETSLRRASVPAARGSGGCTGGRA